MFDILIDISADVFWYNESVYRNSTFPESRLKNDYQSICLHRLHECVIEDIFITQNFNNNDNLSDIFTKSL